MEMPSSGLAPRPLCQKKRPSIVDTSVAGLCFAACLAAVLYGLYLIVPQFH